MPTGDNPKSRKNLKPIKPGEVRNPLGINRKRPITDLYWEVSQEPMPERLIAKFNRKAGFPLLKPGDVWARGVAVRLCFEATMVGLVKSAKELREAIEGKSPQRLEITGPERKEVTLRVVFDRRNQPTAPVVEGGLR